MFDALSSIPGTVDQYLANKMQEAVDVLFQMKIRAEKDLIDKRRQTLYQQVRHTKTAIQGIIEGRMKPNNQILLDTYGDTVKLERPRDGADDDEEPSAGTDRGSKRRRSGKEPASTSAPSETTTKSAGKTTSTGTKTHTKSASHSAPAGDAMHSTDVFKGPADQEFETGIQDEQAEEEVQHPSDWFQKPTRQKPSSTKAADYGHIKWIEDLVPNSMWSQTIVKYDRSALWGISHWGKKRRQFYAFATSRESARDVYSKRRIIAVTKVEIVEWHDYKHLDWITVRRDDDALYTFKEGDFHRLRIQDIEDMLLLLVQGKVTNLSVEERICHLMSP
ncbi:hypothetical protein Tco_0904441 [Tanacetum coccineum]